MLNNGELFWPKTYEKEAYQDELSRRCDVLIVGAGMSGALCAFRFARAGYHTILIDQGEVAGESSAANTGLLQYTSDKLLHECIDDFGEHEAYLFYKASYKGLRDIEEICGMLPEDVGFIKRDSLFYASKRKDKKTIKKEWTMLNKFGFASEYLEEADLKELYGIDKYNALLTHDDAEINPYKFINELLSYTRKHYNLEIREHTKLIDYDEKKSKVICELEDSKITAQNLIITSGYFENKITKKYVEREKFVRSFVIVSKPVDEQYYWKDRAMIWESARPYTYIRHVEGNRILIGGLDESRNKVPNDKKIDKKAEKLLKEFHSLYPDIPFEIEYSYGSIFGETKDGKPFIGKVPGKGPVYCLLGYGGNGTVYSSFGSKMLLDMVMGEEDELEAIFKVDR